MSIVSTLNTASSGLAVTAKMTEITASNVANAMTPGYARREAQISSTVLGNVSGGVQLDSVSRRIDTMLVRSLRDTTSTLNAQQSRTEFLKAFEFLLGTADEGNSLSAHLANLERSLIEAAARPDVESRLAAAVGAAQNLTTRINEISENLHAKREQVDTAIAADVATANSTLQNISTLNRLIQDYTATNRDVSTLLDQRQLALDTLAEIIPLREVVRANNQLTLYSSGGTKLVDGAEAILNFQTTTSITADMSITSGALSGLFIDGKLVSTGPAGGRLGEGRLSALFNLRDIEIPQSQVQIDGLAREIIDRMSAAGFDPSLPIGAAGLFTDAGDAFDPMNEAGLGSRLKVNMAVLPEEGGAYHKLRDGLGAATVGPLGNAELITKIANSISASSRPSSQAFGQSEGSVSDLLNTLMSAAATKRLTAEQSQSFSAARHTMLQQEFLADGINTDDEMQVLLVLEKLYAANAKVLKAADDMLSVILGI